MSEPAKDEAELVKQIATDVQRSIRDGAKFDAIAVSALAAIRAAGWAVVPARLTKDMEYDALRAENARLRAALTWYVNHGAWPVELVRDGGETARAALEVKP
jgi:hypothetical protein